MWYTDDSLDLKLCDGIGAVQLPQVKAAVFAILELDFPAQVLPAFEVKEPVEVDRRGGPDPGGRLPSAPA
jgi:hypothetical protein